MGSREWRREAAACVQIERDAHRRDQKRCPGFRYKEGVGSCARRPHALPTQHRRPHAAAASLPPALASWDHILDSTSVLGKETSLDAAMDTGATVSPTVCTQGPDGILISAVTRS